MNKLVAIAVGVGAVTVGLYAGVSIYTAKVAEAKVNDFVEAVKDEVTVEYRKVSTNPLKSEVVVQDVTLAPVESPEEVINIDQVVVRKLEEGKDLPTALDASLKGIQLSATQVDAPAVSAFLQKAGYQEPLSLNLDTKYEYQESTREVTLEKFRLGAADIGYLDVTFKLGNVDPEATASQEFILHGAEIAYQDNSFAEKLMAAMAAESNQDVAQFKTQLQTGLKQNAQFFITPDNQAAMAILEEVMAFIENPAGFSISVAPQQPLAVSELTSTSDPQTWMDMLNLKIETY